MLSFQKINVGYKQSEICVLWWKQTHFLNADSQGSPEQEADFVSLLFLEDILCFLVSYGNKMALAFPFPSHNARVLSRMAVDQIREGNVLADKVTTVTGGGSLLICIISWD